MIKSYEVNDINSFNALLNGEITVKQFHKINTYVQDTTLRQKPYQLQSHKGRRDDRKQSRQNNGK